MKTLFPIKCISMCVLTARQLGIYPCETLILVTMFSTTRSAKVASLTVVLNVTCLVPPSVISAYPIRLHPAHVLMPSYCHIIDVWVHVYIGGGNGK